MLSPGDRIDRYEVLSVLGQGGMAVVYRARHVELGSEHAIKLLIAIKPQLQERLLQEGRIQARLHHPNLVRVHDVLRVEGRPALVMEFVDGPSLDVYVAANKLSIDTLERLFRGVCAGVAHAHANGMIHRDLKPANVLVHVVDGVPIPKVTDFGIAKVLEFGDSGGTSAGTAMGTPRYMAPEQIRDAKGVDARADVYALGSMLFELLSGRPLVDSVDLVGIYERAMKDEMPDLGDVPDVPVRLVNTIRHALRGERRDRIPDAGALLKVLDTGEFTPAPTVAEPGPAPADVTVDLGIVLRNAPVEGDHTPPTWSEAPSPVGGPEALAVAAPEAIGAWRLVDRIDEHNGMERWHAEKDGRKGLLKALSGDSDRKRIELQKREARVLRQIVHPRVPALIEEFVDGQGSSRRLVIVREDPGGEPLTAYLGRHRFERDEVIPRAADLCDVLAALHRLSPPVVHREITADHVWVASDGTWHIADLGAVRDDLPDQDVGGGTFVGRWGYMAPEQFAGDAGPTTDSYGVGALIVHLLTRRAPSELLDRDGRIVFRPMIADPGLGALLDRMIATDPAARPTAAEAAAALRSLLPKLKPAEPMRAPNAAVIAALQTAPPLEVERPDVSDPMPAPPVLVGPPKLGLAPPPVGLLLPSGIGRVLFAAFVLIGLAVPATILVYSPFGHHVTTPASIPLAPVDLAPLNSTLTGALASPDVKACAVDWRARNPNTLAQRVDVTVMLGTSVNFVGYSNFLDDPLHECLKQVEILSAFENIPVAGPVSLHGTIDLDALAPM